MRTNESGQLNIKWYNHNNLYIIIGGELRLYIGRFTVFC